MVRHRCRFCRRRFSGGRALADHMRSHVTSASKMARQAFPSPSASSSSFPVAAEDGPAAAVAYRLRENPRKSFRLADSEFSTPGAAAEGVAGGSYSVVQDGESDAESSFRRRFGRPRLQEDAFADARPVSSISNTSTEEDVARCLMLLSRDARPKSEARGHQSNGCVEANGDQVEAIYYDDEVVEKKDPPVATRSRRKKTRYQCSTCRKFFRSYQALGGHRASHKRVGLECITTADADADAADREPMLFDCPYCYRVFSSGQALGGHKRSHLSSAIDVATKVPALLPPPQLSALAINDDFIDLNVPAPLEEEPDHSALSVATEFASK
ncbi:unnamed protein product [Musa hybrid cultivar]